MWAMSVYSAEGKSPPTSSVDFSEAGQLWPAHYVLVTFVQTVRHIRGVKSVCVCVFFCLDTQSTTPTSTRCCLFKFPGLVNARHKLLCRNVANCASMQFKKNGHNGVLFLGGDNGWLRLSSLTEWRYNEVAVTYTLSIYRISFLHC